MAKLITDVVLKDGTDETTFINDVTSNENVDLLNRVSSLNNMVVLNVEENYLDTLRSHTSVLSANTSNDITEPVVYPSTPSKYTIANKSIGGTGFYTNISGQQYLGFQHYFDTDCIPEPDNRTINGFTGNKVGNSFFYVSPYGKFDQIRYYGTQPSSSSGQFGTEDLTYFSTWTGKNVDIVAFEGGSTSVDSNYTNYHNNHPDFQDPDNAGTTRCIPMNWPNTTSAVNNQVSHNTMFTNHSTGTMSVCAGVHGGLAKKSNLRIAYTSGEGIAAGYNSILTWHQSKSTNSATGFVNPTILITEYHSPTNQKDSYVRIDDIASVTDPTHGTTNRPGSGWGSDLTPFVKRNFIPFQLLDPSDSVWRWCIGFCSTIRTSDHTALTQLWDAGVHVVSSVGNGGAIYCRTTDPEYNGSYLTMNSGNYYKYTIIYPASGVQTDEISIIRGLDNVTTIYPLRPHGPGGLAKSINVAAGNNSEGVMTFDGYSARGPGVDIVGRGTATYAARGYGDARQGFPAANTLADGFKWGTFGGTSCAMPTVAGKLACLIEKYFTLNGVYPTPDQAKAMLVSEARNSVVSVRTTTWSNVPTASATPIAPEQDLGGLTGAGYGQSCLKVQAGTTTATSGTRFVDAAGTPLKHAFLNVQTYNREQTYKRRPKTGVLFPRPRKFDIPPVEIDGT